MQKITYSISSHLCMSGNVFPNTTNNLLHGFDISELVEFYFHRHGHKKREELINQDRDR